MTDAAARVRPVRVMNNVSTVVYALALNALIRVMRTPIAQGANHVMWRRVAADSREIVKTMPTATACGVLTVYVLRCAAR